MTYTAKAALPFPDAHQAVPGLRGQLRRLVTNDGRRPEWATLRVVGPVEVVGARGRVWYEWTATVDAAGSDVHVG